jgi:signal transduction histidine kinase/ligand-binding sensor domain-containing protein
MKAKVLLLLLLAAPALPRAAQAQAPAGHFERIALEQGLSQVTIYCILQDSRGWMWFGTEDGLNQYDGYTFRVYKRDPQDPRSLSANTVRAIYEDQAGSLWVGTDGGLNRFDRAAQQFTPYRHDRADPHSLSHDLVTAVAGDSSGRLWVGTGGGGLNRFDPATGQFTHYRHDPDDPYSLSHDEVTAIYAEAPGRLWIGTKGGGLNRFDPAAGQFTHYRHDPADPNSLSHDQVTSIQADPAGRLWIGTDGGGLNMLVEAGRPEERFIHYRHDPDDPHSLSHDGVAAVYAGASGRLWVGTSMGGLNELVASAPGSPAAGAHFVHHRNDPLNPHSLSDDNVTALYGDASGVLWIGTAIAGLNKLDGKARRFAHYRHDPADPYSLGSNTVWAIYEDSTGALWVGTSGPGGGLERLVRDEEEGPAGEAARFVHYRNAPGGPGDSAVTALHEDSRGALWIGTYARGVYQLVRGRSPGQKEVPEQFTLYRHDPADPHSLSHDTITAIYEDRSGALWIGTFGGGLNRLERAPAGRGEGFVHYRHTPDAPDSLCGDVILSIYEDRLGALWVGTTQGLSQLAPEARKAPAPGRQSPACYRNDPADPRSLGSNAIAALYEDRDGTLWIGTDDGLNRFERETGIFVQYTEKDGLANDAVAGILEDEQGQLWLSTGRGLSRFNPHTGTFKNYDVRDGLQSNEFNRAAYHMNRRGVMFFGGINGFNAFSPADIVDNPHVPPVVITDFQILNRPVGIGGDSPLAAAVGEIDEIRLSYRDYVFSFEFAALDYSMPSKNQYAYMLEGFDPNWNYVDSGRRLASYANLPAGRYTFRVKGSNNDGAWNEAGTAMRIIVAPPPWKTWWAYALYTAAGAGLGLGFIRYRTREIERRHLEQTMWAVQKERDRIAALLETRRQLVACISHDLRAPVTLLRGHLEAVLEPGRAPAAAGPDGMQAWIAGERQRLEVMLQELAHLQTLLDDLFTLSRLEVGQLALRPAAMDVAPVARRAVSSIAWPAWQQGRVTVDLEVPEAGLWAVADEQRLLQVLMNLLQNAVRHTLPGGLVAVSLGGSEDHIDIQVRDTGEGIRPDDLPYIWERFYQGSSACTGGTGLGLALVKELTEAMGGSVGVSSTPGEGSCFTLILPRAADAAPAGRPDY